MIRISAVGLWLVCFASSCRPVTQPVALLPVDARLPRETVPAHSGSDRWEDPVRLAEQAGFPMSTMYLAVEHGDQAIFDPVMNGLVTPAVEWATGYVNGPIRVLYVTNPAFDERTPFELRQRSGFSITPFHTPSCFSSLIVEPEFAAWWRDQIRTQITEANYDVIVLNSWALLAANTELFEAVTAKVKAGCGLICLQETYQWGGKITDTFAAFNALSPIDYAPGGVSWGQPTRVADAHPIIAGVSCALWPLTYRNGTPADAGATTLVELGGGPMLAVSTYGQGRVVGISTLMVNHAGIVPEWNDENTPKWDEYWEPVYALWLRALVWAARKEPHVLVQAPDAVTLTAGQQPVVPLTLGDSSGSLTITTRLRDPFGATVPGLAPSVTLTNGAAVITGPPLHVNGKHHLYYWVHQAQAVETWGSVALVVTGGVPFAAAPFPTNTTAWAVGGTASFQVATGSGTGTVAVTGLDGHDRIFDYTSQSVTNGQMIQVDLAKSLSPNNRVEFAYAENGIVVGKAALRVAVPRIGLDALQGELLVASYGSTAPPAYLAGYMGDLYRLAGFNTVWSCLDPAAFYQCYTMGLHALCGGVSPEVRHHDLKLTELPHCPNKPATREGWDKDLALRKPIIQQYGAVSRVLDDEGFYAYLDNTQTGQQVCQCADCTAEFRAKLAAKYPGIAALNQAWGTSYGGFDEVVPMTEADIVGDNPAGWVEWRNYNNGVYAHQYYGYLQARHADLGGDFRVGPGAPCWTSARYGPTYLGGDYSQLKSNLTFGMFYGELNDSIALPQVFGGQPGAQKSDAPQHWQNWGPWMQMFNGAKALWYYYGSAIIGQELAWRRHGDWLAEGLRDLRDGIGPLLRDATPRNTEVRIYYSPESLATQFWLSKHPVPARYLGADTTTKTMQTLCRELLYLQPSFIDADEIRNGGLTGCRLLILPLITNMDDATAAAIREYVSRGGFVVADLLPATRDRMGTPRAASSLAALFGVAANGNEYHRETPATGSQVHAAAGLRATTGVTPGAEWRTWLPADTWQTGLAATTATALGELRGDDGHTEPAFLLNQTGAGHTLLLNFLYRDLTATTALAHRRFGQDLVRWVGLLPPAEIVDPGTNEPLPYRPLYAFTYGRATLLGSLRGQFTTVTQPNWTLIDFGAPFQPDPRARVRWDGPRHIYDVRERQYLGQGTEATLKLPSFQARLLSLLPYRVTEVQLRAAGSVRRGSIATVTAQVRTSAAPSQHLLRLEVVSPTGYRTLPYSRLETAPHGAATFTIPFAYNDRPGVWQITVRDVLTGTEGHHDITVE